MAQEYLDAVRRGYEAFIAGDLGSVLEFIHPEVRLVDSPSLPDPRVLRGHHGLREWVARESEHQEGWRIEVERYVAAGDEVVVLMTQHATGRHSGIDMTRPLAHVWRVEDGRGVEVRAYSTWDDALAAAGVAGP